MPAARTEQEHPVQPAEKFGGLEVSDAKRLRALEVENQRLRRIIADQALDITMLKDVVSKNGGARRSARGGGPSDRNACSSRAASSVKDA